MENRCAPQVSGHFTESSRKLPEICAATVGSRDFRGIVESGRGRMSAQPDVVTHDFVMPSGASVRAGAATIDTRAVLAAGVDAYPVDARPAIALALWEDTSIGTAQLKAAAEQACAVREPQLHTFVPLYTTNHCDSECKMCSMRKGNARMER